MQSRWSKLWPASVYAKVKANPGLQRILGNTGWLVADRIVRLVIGLFISVWLARYLGPEQFGLLNYAVAFAALFGTLATLGLNQIVVRDLIKSSSSTTEILGSAFALKFAGGCLAFLLVIVAATAFHPSDTLTRLLLTIIALGMMFQAFDTIQLWFEAQVQAKFTVCAKSAAFFLVSVAKVILILGQAPLIAFAWAATVEIMLGSLGLITVYRATGQRLSKWQFNVSTATSLLKDGWPLILAGLSIMIYMKIDLIMLGILASDEAVGIYSAATRISEMWYFIPLVIVSSVTPSIFETEKVSRKLYYDRLSRLFHLLAAISLLVAIPTTLLAWPVINLFFGSEYAEASTVLAIHIWSLNFVSLGVGQSPWLINEGLTKLSMYRTMAGAVANIVLNLLLIPAFGATGAAIATVISYSVSALLANVLDERVRRIFYMQIEALFLKNYLWGKK